MGPTRVFHPAAIIPSRLISSCVGAMPTTLFFHEGWRIDPPVSSATLQVTRLADTDEPDPPLELPGDRSVSYGLQSTPPNPLRLMPVARSPRFAFARTIAPASRSRLMNVASSGGRS